MIGEVLKRRYEVEAVAGEGAMGVVYRVVDRMDGTVRALKTLDLDRVPAADVDEARMLFEREARFLFNLGHPGFPRVTDYFTDGSMCFQVMDLIEGETLEARVEREGPLAEADVIKLGLALAGHLQFLHQHPAGPIVYRDLKPSNVMVASDGRYYIVDFGIARVYKAGVKSDTQFLGTPGYAAPEQYGGKQTSPLADLYALAATLRFALSGDHPMPFGVPQKPLQVQLPLLAWLLDTCMMEMPYKRPSSAAAVIEILLDAGCQPPPLGEALRRWFRGDFLRLPRHGLGFHVTWWSAIGTALLVMMTCATLHPRHNPPARACQRNLCKIGEELNAAYVPMSGKGYPISPSRAILTCPTTGRSYVYERHDHNGSVIHDGPDSFTVSCTGRHEYLPPGYPQYTSRNGLVSP